MTLISFNFKVSKFGNSAPFKSAAISLIQPTGTAIPSPNL
jgi:hypothetical protein